MGANKSGIAPLQFCGNGNRRPWVDGIIHFHSKLTQINAINPTEPSIKPSILDTNYLKRLNGPVPSRNKVAGPHLNRALKIHYI